MTRVDTRKPASRPSEAPALEPQRSTLALAADTRARVDVLKVLDRIAAAMAALDDVHVAEQKRRVGEHATPPAEPKIRLRHNWG